MARHCKNYYFIIRQWFWVDDFASWRKSCKDLQVAVRKVGVPVGDQCDETQLNSWATGFDPFATHPTSWVEQHHADKHIYRPKPGVL
jgi:hypothetical protein